MKTFLLLFAAAMLEVGGDALIRVGLKGHGVLAMVLGAVVLVTYGFMVNLTGLDFNRLMGVYVVFIFVVAQGIAIVFFREKLPMLVGGSLVIAGGLTMACWRTP